MRKPLIILFAALSLSVSAQQKVDLITTSAISRLPQDKATPVASNLLKSTVSTPDNQGNMRLLIEVNDNTDLASLRELGAEITGVYGDVITCTMPAENVMQLNDQENVKSVTSARRVRLLNDKGRSTSGMNVDAVHQGTSLPQTYKGDGVIVGIFDSGFDTNHINFYDDQQQASRISRVWVYSANYYGAITEKAYTNPTAIANLSTENAEETHGTHVLGTITGSYDGGTSTTSYYGMAPHADIAIGCGEMYEDAILSGVRNIVDYAESQNKPVVINMSLGTSIGHHDHTSPFNKALDEIAKDATIVLAAGNEGDLNIALRKTFSADDNKLMTVIDPSYYLTNQYPAYQAFGNIEIIGNDSKAFTLSLGLYNTTTNALVATLPITSHNWTYWGNSYANVDGTKKTDTNFTSAFYSDSYFGAAVAICPDNNRYYAMIDMDMYYKTSSKKIVPVIIIEGKEGQTVDLYTDSYTEFASRNIEGYSNGTTDGTISDMACGLNTISVGAYTTRNSYPYSGEIVNDILSYSSYGKLIDGRTLPHITAPGQAIISSMSTPFKSSSYFNSTYNKIYSTVTANGRDNYWCHMGGTSMATPGVSGCIALWLEANPDLTPEQVREIAIETARQDSYVTDGNFQAPYQWGAGKIDAYEGIKLALEYKDSGVEDVIADDSARLMVQNLGNDNYEIFLAGEESITASVYSVSGALAMSSSANGNTLTLDCSSLASGIYIIHANGHSAKISIR